MSSNRQAPKGKRSTANSSTTKPGKRTRTTEETAAPKSKAGETGEQAPGHADGDEAQIHELGRRLARREGETFEPSEAQVSMLTQFLTASEGTTVREMCERAGIHHSTFYRWMQRPAFRHWWNECTETVLRGRRSSVLAALTKRAEAGDLSAIKVWLQRFDRVDSGERQTMQDVYRELIRRFATDEFLARLRHEPNDTATSPASKAKDGATNKSDTGELQENKEGRANRESNESNDVPTQRETDGRA